MENRLQAHQELITTVFLEIQDAFYLRDLRGNYLLVNPAYAALMGEPRNAFEGKDIFVMAQSELARRILQRDREVLREGHTKTSEECLQLEGGERCFQITCGLCRNEQRLPMAVFGLIRDTTTEKQLLKASSLAESRLRAVWEMAADAMVMTDRAGSILTVNPAYLQLCGYRAEDLIGKSIFSFAPEAERTHLQEQYHSLFTQSQETALFEGNTYRKNGAPVLCETRISFLKMKGERMAMMSSVRDISRRKQIEEKLRQSEALLAETQHLAHLGSFQIDLQKNRVEWSKEAYRMLALNPAMGEISLEACLSMIHPEDRDQMWTAIESTVLKLERAEVDFRIRTSTGETRQIQSVLSPAADHTGTVVRILGTMLDITSRKDESLRLQAEARRSAALASLSQTFAEAGLDIPALTRIVAETTANLYEAVCIIYLYSEDGEWLEVKSYHHPDPAICRSLASHLNTSRSKEEEWIPGGLEEGGQPIFCPAPTQAQVESLLPPNLRAFFNHNHLRSLVSIPLKAQARRVGNLLLARLNYPHPFTEEDVTFLQELSLRAAFAMDNARLYASEARRTAELRALYKATTALLGTLDLDALLGRILDAALQAIPAANKGQLNLVAPQTGPLEVRAGTGWNDPRIRTLSNQRMNGYLARSVREGRPFLVNSFQEQTDPDETGAAVIAPLMLGEKSLGAILLTAAQASAFSQADLQLLVSFAATTSAALQSAMLHAEVQRMAVTDSLTGLYNRRGFFELAHKELERAKRFHHKVSVLMLDIDHFKQINDTRGHAAGDEAIRLVSTNLAAGLRDFDLIGRLGGDEFIILLPETDLKMAIVVADRLRRRIAGLEFSSDGSRFKATISLGAAQTDWKDLNLDKLLRQADQALYRAKTAGRNRVEGMPLLGTTGL